MCSPLSRWRNRLGSTLAILGLLSTLSVEASATSAPMAPWQEATGLVELRLRDGSVIYGVIETETPDQVVVRTLAGAVVEVDRAQIASLEPAAGTVVDGEFRPADANATRLLFSPTGRSLRRGQGYVGVYELILPFVQVGLTDRFSMGIGTPLLFFGDELSRPVWLTPKYQFLDSDRVDAAAGLMHFDVFGEDGRVGVAYVVATVGTEDNAWTVGTGWVYSRYYENEYAAGCFSRPHPTCEPERVARDERSPIGMVGGERRISRRLKLVSENYVFRSGGIASIGVRFIGERLSADVGAFAPLAAGGTFVAPVVNFVWTFGG